MPDELVLSAVGPEEARHDRRAGRARWRFGALFALVFLISGVVAIVQSGRPPLLIAADLALLAVFGAWYVLVPAIALTRTLPFRVVAVAGQFLLSLPLFPVLGSGTASLWVYAGLVAGMLLAFPAAVAVAVVLGAGLVLIDHDSPGDSRWVVAITIVSLTVFMAAFARLIRLSMELRRTRAELAQAAVAGERVRIGRDLHDILGHSLTAITVKAALARRLASRDPAGAAAEMADVERLAREALADVRATASGYREVSLGTELAVSAAVLRAAGIVADLPTAIDDVDPRAREVFAFVLREAITNVVRHSGARCATVTLTPRRIRITDDGRGPVPDARAGGHGLAGLSARVAEAGGVLHVDTRPGGGFVVEAELDPPGREPADRPVVAAPPVG